MLLSPFTPPFPHPTAISGQEPMLVVIHMSVKVNLVMKKDTKEIFAMKILRKVQDTLLIVRSCAHSIPPDGHVREGPGGTRQGRTRHLSTGREE